MHRRLARERGSNVIARLMLQYRYECRYGSLISNRDIQASRTHGAWNAPIPWMRSGRVSHTPERAHSMTWKNIRVANTCLPACLCYEVGENFPVVRTERMNTACSAVPLCRKMGGWDCWDSGSAVGNGMLRTFWRRVAGRQGWEGCAHGYRSLCCASLSRKRRIAPFPPQLTMFPYHVVGVVVWLYLWCGLVAGRGQNAWIQGMLRFVRPAVH